MSMTFLACHFVFSTKNREPLISLSFREDLYRYIGGILRAKQCACIEIGGVEDHIHILASLHPSHAIADIVRDMKSGSSRWVNESRLCPGHFSWQVKYGAFSVSKSGIEKVVDYIRNQEEHHRKVTFQEELIALLKRHGIEYDERYLWE